MVRGLELIPMHNVVDAAFADIHGFGNCTKFIVMQTCCRFLVVRKGDWKSKLETLMRSCFRLCVNAAGAVKRRISHDSCS